jgi:hypothetical protein
VAGSTGNIFPTVGATVDRAGNTAWTNPGNVVSDNGSGATATVPTDYLVTSAYGFAIPATCRILGVTVRVEATETGSGSSSYIPQLHSATTPTLIGSAKSAVTVTNGPTVSSNGGVADLWSATLTPAIVNAAGFGVSIWSTDTINALDIDYVTIAIEYGEEAPWLTGRETFLRRRNTTNHRLVTVDLPLDLEPPVVLSDDRALEEPFVTRVIRSRRALSIGWMDALTAQVQAPEVPPVAAWLVVQTPRRRETERRLLVADVTPIERYTPPSIAWSDPPKVIRVEFRRKLQELAAQVELPQPVAPPTAQDFPAWATVQLPPTHQDRRHLSVAELDAYPETPRPEPNFCARIPTGFHKRRETERRLLTVELDEFTETPAGEVSDDRALESAFVTRKIRSRRHLRAPELLSVDAAEEPEPTPATLGSVTQVKAKRRKSRQGLFLSSADVVESRVQAQYPSYVLLRALRRKDTERRLVEVLVPPVYPETPPPPEQPEISWRAVKANRVEHERRLLEVPAHDVYPVTPVYAANQLVRAIRRRETERKLRVAEHSPSYPSTPAPEQAPTAFKLAEGFRRHGWRKLRKVLEINEYPQTVVVEVPDVVGETEAAGTTELEAVLFVVSVSYSYSSSVAEGLIISQDPIGGTFANEGSTVSIVVSLGPEPADDEVAGGWLFLNQYNAELERRKAAERRRKKLEEETEQIENELDRNIAQLMREQEAVEAKRSDLERLAELAKKNADVEAARLYSERVGDAFAKALVEGSIQAALVLEQELKRAKDEEEEFLLTAMLMLMDQ